MTFYCMSCGNGLELPSSKLVPRHCLKCGSTMFSTDQPQQELVMVTVLPKPCPHCGKNINEPPEKPHV